VKGKKAIKISFPKATDAMKRNLFQTIFSFSTLAEFVNATLFAILSHSGGLCTFSI
jgi:hypothetical protein